MRNQNLQFQNAANAYIGQNVRMIFHRVKGERLGAVGALFGGISADRSPSWPHSSSFLTRGNATPFDGRSGSAPNDGDGDHRVSSEVFPLNFAK